MSHDNFSGKNKVREKPYNAVTAERSGQTSPICGQI